MNTEFSIFEFGHIVFFYFIHAEAAFYFVFNLRKRVPRYYKIIFMKRLTHAILLWHIATNPAEVWVAKLHSNIYKFANKVSLVLKYPEKKLCLLLKHKFWSHTILTNFDLTKIFDFILTFQSIQN